MVNQRDKICKYNYIKFDASIRKNNKAKTKNKNKSGINNKNIKNKEHFIVAQSNMVNKPSHKEHESLNSIKKKT